MRLANREEGYTIVAVVGSIAVVTLLAGAALAATNADLGLVSRDLDEKRALAAAQAGVGDYQYHLNNDNAYWARCTTVPSPHAVNQVGSTANRRPVPGESDAQYAIELLPRTGQSGCSVTNPVGTMLEQSGPNTGTFRIRSTGYVADTSRSVVATFKRASFLDYIYFTQYETSDPVVYGNPPWIQNAYTHCSRFIRDGRQSSTIPGSGGRYCDKIVFVSGDDIDGPMHTNDGFVILGSPSFGRSAADVIESSALPMDAPPPATPQQKGWMHCSAIPPGSCGSGNPNFVGVFKTNAPVLTPPPTNTKLRSIAEASGTLYSCQTSIVLNGNNMTVTVGTGVPPTGSTETRAIPESGVVYIANDSGPEPCSSTSCSTTYSPYTATYPTSSPCGNALVRTASGGNYTGQLTIAAQNDVIVNGNIIRSGGGLLGLVANNFVRVKHPVCRSGSGQSLGCSSGSVPAQTGQGNCNSGVNQNSLSNLRIDAAILAIQHSFIVDHYDCGAELGELEVNGAISQKFRGAVGTTGDTGYLKDYNYDDRLRYQSPPEYLDPVQSAWHIQRETLDFP
jgi:hypothetical protein